MNTDKTTSKASAGLKVAHSQWYAALRRDTKQYIVFQSRTERELRLWMRKHIETNNLPESWAHLNVAGVYCGNDSKGGAWIHVQTHYATSGRKFNFKARPATPWAIVERKAVAQ